MKIRTPTMSAWLSFLGTLIILINVLAIASSGSSIVIPSGSFSSIDDILSSNIPWYRVAFGIKSLVEGPMIIIWLLIAVLNFSLASLMVLTSEKPKGNLPIFILSMVLLLTGGGFVIGSVLAIIGCIMSFQWWRPIGETFMGKFLRVLRLDPTLFQLVKKSKNLLNEAVFIVILACFLSSLGMGIYLYNANLITHSAAENVVRILLFGEVFFDISIFSIPIMNISLTMIKWLILSFIIFLIGSKVAGIGEVDFSDVARVIGYAYAPLTIQVFLPLIFSNEPILSTGWPLTMMLITNFWMFLALLIAVKECFDVSLTKALGIILFGGPIYWIIVYKIMLPLMFWSSHVPGIIFDIKPIELTVMLTSLSFILSYILGTFKRY